MPKKIISIDATTLNSFQMCEGHFYYRHILDRAESVKRDFFEKGDLIHQMLKSYYRIYRARDKWKKEYTHDDVVKMVGKYGMFYSQALSIDTDTCARIIHTFTEYANFWKGSWVPLFVEEVASKVIYEDENYIFIMVGKIDLIVEERQLPQGKLIVDHKSSERNTKLSELSNQFMCYSWMLGIMHVTINRIGLQKTLKPEEKYVRIPLCYSPDKINWWVDNTVEWIKRLISAMEKDKYLFNLT